MREKEEEKEEGDEEEEWETNEKEKLAREMYIMSNLHHYHPFDADEMGSSFSLILLSFFFSLFLFPSISLFPSFSHSRKRKKLELFLISWKIEKLDGKYLRYITDHQVK